MWIPPIIWKGLGMHQCLPSPSASVVSIKTDLLQPPSRDMDPKLWITKLQIPIQIPGQAQSRSHSEVARILEIGTWNIWPVPGTSKANLLTLTSFKSRVWLHGRRLSDTSLPDVTLLWKDLYNPPTFIIVSVSVKGPNHWVLWEYN